MTVALSNQGFDLATGLVKVLKYINGTWTQQGSDCIGNSTREKIGSDIDLSSNGTIVAYSSKPGNSIVIHI